MKYVSTRDNHEAVESAWAIQRGMVPMGGLFVPEAIPAFSVTESIVTYGELASKILGLYLTDFSKNELDEFVSKAYTKEKFNDERVAPVVKIGEGTHVLELWHGPTAAFKDVALQILPFLLTGSVVKNGSKDEIIILVATSGDTGKAALEGFKDVPGTKVIVFYPKNGVSHIQEKQMLTTTGKNTFVIGVNGNFDDCQAMVKEIFSDKDFGIELSKHNKELSSANSINWGRLVPQIVYYYWAYYRLLAEGSIQSGEPVNFAVPTGNFGDILAGYYAMKMGLPVKKLICASNKNKILTDFFKTGVYDLHRDFHKTSSPSMDILVSSNLERFLFEMTNRDGREIASLYAELEKSGKFEVSAEVLERMSSILVAGYAEEMDVREEIRDVFNKDQYLMDTHTAVASHVTRSLSESGAISGETVILSTASAYKFSQSVFNALAGEGRADDEYALLEALQQMTGITVHRSLKGLENLQVRDEIFIERNESRDIIRKILDI